MGVYVEDSWKIGGGCADIRALFHGGCVVSYPLWIIDVDGDSPRDKYAGRVPTQCGLPADLGETSLDV